MTDRGYIVSRTLENKIAIAEINHQDPMLVTPEVMKEILAILKDQQELIAQYESKCQTCKSRLEGVKPF